MVTSVELLGPGGSPKAPENVPRQPETLLKGPSQAPKQSPGGPPAASLSVPEAVVWGSWGGLGGSGAALERSWRSWPASGRSRLLLDRSGAVLDGPGRLPGPILTALGRLQARSLRFLTGCSSALGQRFRWFLRLPRCLRGDAWGFRRPTEPSSPVYRSSEAFLGRPGLPRASLGASEAARRGPPKSEQRQFRRQSERKRRSQGRREPPRLAQLKSGRAKQSSRSSDID